MNSNQSKNLTPKQQELVKRLESIRSNRDTTNEKLNKPEETKRPVRSQGRNEHARQSRPASTSSRKKRTRTSKPSEFARPVVEPPVTAAPKAEYTPKVARPRKRVQQQRVAAKKRTNEDHYIKQLTDGKKLSQAIILSEILAKPVALRKR